MTDNFSGEAQAQTNQLTSGLSFTQTMLLALNRWFFIVA
jgi:hypothetical protein